jgi:hypothetical protein
MKTKTLLVTMSALALLGGCNRGASGNNSSAANSSTTNASAAAPASGAAAQGGAVDQAFIQGNWGNGNCAQTFSFNADGTATNSMDSEVARWTLAGNTLTITPPNQAPQTSTLAKQGDNLVMTRDGQPVTLTRCAAAAAASGPAAAGAADASANEADEGDAEEK